MRNTWDELDIARMLEELVKKKDGLPSVAEVGLLLQASFLIKALHEQNESQRKYIRKLEGLPEDEREPQPPVVPHD